jgi:hypothetical protein
MSFAFELHKAIAKACPIGGVSIGSRFDRSAWKAQVHPDATREQIEAMEEIVAKFPYPEKTQEQEVKDLIDRQAKIEAAIGKLIGE